jgi:hypothetical protein
VLYPNGEEEIWILPPANISWVDAGKYGIKLRPHGLGKAGFGLGISRMAFRQPIVAFGVKEDGDPYPPKGEVAPDLWCLELVQYDTTPEAREFRAWYEGRGPIPSWVEPGGEIMWVWLFLLLWLSLFLLGLVADN